MGLRADFWRGKRVLLTGHTGFKGAWLSLWLQHLGATLTGFALAPQTAPSLFTLTEAGLGMNSHLADIRDLAAVRSAVQRADPQIVIHMAAQALVRASYDDPVGTYSANVMGTVNLLESLRGSNALRSVVVVTSDKCYENREWTWGYRESDPLGGYDPYSNSKACAELVTAAWRSSFFPVDRRAQHGVSIATARAGNVIGGGDWGADRLVPDILRAYAAGEPVVLRYPDAVRPWQHVLEPLGGYLLLAERLYEGRGEESGAWNFGPAGEDARPVRWVADEIARRWGPRARWQADSTLQPHEARTLKLDCSKARQELGWQPRWSLETALDNIVDWHRTFTESGDVAAKTLEQIRKFEQHEF